MATRVKWNGETIEQLAQDPERYRDLLESMAADAAEYDNLDHPAPDTEEVTNFWTRVGNGIVEYRLTVGMLRRARELLR